jgi:hypothetical protein
MDRDTFWTIVDSARSAVGVDDEAFLDRVREQLEKLVPEEVIAFDAIQDELMAESYRRDLWAAAYIINGGCSDDGFDYFRAWLIAQGRAVFDRAVADPATLESAIVTDPAWDAELEEFLYLPGSVYEERFGEEMPERYRPAGELTGPEWDEDSIYEMFPKLLEVAESRFGT